VRKSFEVVDMFCGAGGESTGIMQAAAAREMNIHLTAINHWERAIETHATNHPSAEHLCESVERIDPTKAIPGGKVNLLWASPECTHHSVARGGRPRSDQSRASAWLILKWLSELYVERVIIENVPEFLSWGPLDDTGRPIQTLKGKTFRAFVTSLRSLGYIVDWKILIAADYGDPTTRRRLFIQAVKGRKRIVWPEITHMDRDGVNLMGYLPWRPARDIIDWSIPGTSIFDRKKPLADATIRRIAAGIEKYWKDYAKPFLAVLYGSNDVRSLDIPLPSVTTSGAHHALVEPVPLLMGHESGQMPKPVNDPVQTVLAQGRINLIQPFLTRFHGGVGSENRNHTLDKPIPTLDTSNRYGLVEPLLVDFTHKNDPYPIDQPLRTITTKCHFGLLEPLCMEYYGNGQTKPVSVPLGTVTTKDRFALIEPSAAYGLDIRFRMLKNHELKRAQGFPDDYEIKGNGPRFGCTYA
jgi:DNA (cytosine-5)-methyltransferase 1